MLVGTFPDDKLPHALQAMQESRQSIISGRVTWSVEYPDRERVRTVNYVSRYARNGDTIVEQRGDDDGWTGFDSETGEGKSRFPLLFMINRDGVWHYPETAGSATLWGDRRILESDELRAHAPSLDQLRSVREVGTFAADTTFMKGFDPVWIGADDGPFRWEESFVGDHYIVVRYDQSGVKTTWHIDPSRGWNAEWVKIETASGRVVAEARSSLRKYGDARFPEATTYYSDGKKRADITIRSAALNDAEDPAAIGPADLGLTPGINVDVVGADSGIQIWNGDGIVGASSWIADLKSGARRRGDVMQRIAEGMPSPYNTAQELRDMASLRQTARVRLASTGHESVWERYVAQFIEHYRLDPEQMQQAWRVHRDCVDRASEQIQKRRDSLHRLDQQLDAAQRSNDKAQTASVTRKQSELLRVIEDVFERQLKPRLEGIPTRAQRQAAEATSKPAGSPHGSAAGTPP